MKDNLVISRNQLNIYITLINRDNCQFVWETQLEVVINDYGDSN